MPSNEDRHATVRCVFCQTPNRVNLAKLSNGPKCGNCQRPILLDRPIKAIGVQEVKIALHPEVAVTVKVNVARSPEEADLQAQGIDVMAQMFERDTTAFTEDFDPNAEPGATAETPAEAAPEAPAEAAPAEGEEQQG